MLEVSMDKSKSSQIKINDDAPTGIASQAHGMNTDAVAFNISFITSKNPTLALQIMKLYREAHKISASDPPYPEEDYKAALNDLQALFE